MNSDQKPKINQTPAGLARRCAIAVSLLLQLPLGASWAQGVLGTSPETATPVWAARGGVPLVMLTMARDHTLFFPAYNDLSDLDGDGALDIRFKPTFEYVGLYNSYYCYRFDSANGYFYPDQDLGTDLGPCSASGTQSELWSGNFLNYVTTSRMDALRVALYGGTRETEAATDTFTVLRRAYIPQDGHAWAKEYSSFAVDGYNISQYTPLANPTSTDRRHFFGSLTSTAAVNATTDYTYTGTDYPPVGVSCETLANCSNFAPLLRVVSNSDTRVWDWASSERPVLSAVAKPKSWGNAGKGYGAGTLTDYTVRVKVCEADYSSGCKQYPNGNYKPVGVLHEYGEDESMYFGLLTGSYDQNLSGGRVRKNIGSFKDEINANTGIFTNPTFSLVSQINNIRIRNFSYYTSPANDGNNAYYSGNFTYRNGNLPAPVSYYNNDIFDNSYGSLSNATGTYHTMTEGEYGDWGNPVAEMMYEGLRYFAGAGKTSAYDNGTTTDDEQVGLARPTWASPYTATNWCAKPSQMVISSVNPSFDSDQLPGSRFGTMGSWEAPSGATLAVGTLTDTIGSAEGVHSTSRFIGESGTATDGAPTLKNIVALGSVRGLPPDDTNKQGSYYAAAVAHFGKANSLQTVGSNPIPSVDTFAVLMNKPIPEIVIPFSDGKKITVVPFARTIDAPNATKGGFQPTNQIVGMYITSFDNPTNNNGSGGYYLKFYINYEDRSWGGDFDMDAIAEYEIKATSTDVTIKVTPTYGASGSKQNMGYVISGTGTTTTSTDGTSSTTSTDGTYLVVQNMNVSAPYYLNVPLDRSAGYCDPGTSLDDCNILPNLPSGGSSTKVFKPIAGASNYYLKDPLWYAAKWGGYSGGVAPTTAGGDDPDNYAQVTSPAKLRAAFAKTFENILNRSSTTGAVSASSSQLIADTKLFQSSFNQKYFYGDLNATRFSVTPGTDTNNGTSSYTPAWSAGSAASQLPALVSSGKRRIYYKNKTAGSLKTFEWSNIETDYSTVNLTSDIVSYLRGDQTKETWNTGGKFRSRRTTGTTNGGTTNVDNLLGGLINSAPVYSDDTKTVYVGSNDGMLHAFDSENGSERFAYLPGAVFSNLYRLSDPTFSHRYYVDGQIAVSNKNDTGGINYLVGFMGRGAKGLYVLQVGNASNTTNYPNGVNTTTGAWEYFGIDINGVEDKVLGYLLGKPLIEKLQDGTDVVIFGNGYNSTNNEATLYVMNLKTGNIIARFGTSVGGSKNPNGLATPTVTRKNGRVEYVYAGDYHGNVWRFDLSGSRSTYAGWNSVGRGSTLIKRIFQAKDSGGNRQNITAPLATAVVSNNNPSAPATSRFVFFGTGSDLTTAHAANTTQNTMYGLIDTTVGTTDASPINGRANLTQRTIETVTGTYGSYSRNSSVGVRSFSTKVANDMNGKYGWYMDWTKPASGPSERVVSAATVRNAATPTLVVSSNVFASYSCDRTGQGFLNAMDAYYGGGLTESYFDINRNRSHADEKFTVNGVDKIISSIDFGSGNIGGGGFPDDNVVVQGTEREDDTKTKSNKIRSSRISWREVVK